MGHHKHHSETEVLGLLRSATDIIIKGDSYFITKCGTSLLQNASAFYYKMRQLLQNMTILLQNVTFITKCVGTMLLISFSISLISISDVKCANASFFGIFCMILKYKQLYLFFLE